MLRNSVTVYYFKKVLLIYYQKMYSNRCNIDGFVIREEQKSSEEKDSCYEMSPSNLNAFYSYRMLDCSEYVTKIVLDL